MAKRTAPIAKNDESRHARRNAGFAQTLVEFPPVQKAASFTINDAMDKMAAAGGGAGG